MKVRTSCPLFPGLLAAALCCPAAAMAQQPEEKERAFDVMINVRDDVTYEGLKGVKMELLRPDSTYIADLEYAEGTTEKMGRVYASVFGSINVTKGSYLIRCTHPDYDTLYVSFTTPTHRRAYKSIWLPDADMHRKPREREYQLGEAVVRATKIKMVMHGDTVVYNADAFQLARGSMLDALVERLPGVELRDGGVILYHGKRVESLLLGGRNFFEGNPSVALDNLPAYMVDKVKVYERTTAFDRFRGAEVENKPLVMDVNLKKEFSVGWLANAEAAYGSRDRYLGRLFALGFTPKTFTTVFANLNNTNDTRRPGRRGDWTPAAAPTGLQAAKNVGAEFSYEDPNTGNRWTTDLTWLHTDLDRTERANSETFLPEGSTYSLSDADRDECATSVRLENYYGYSSKIIYAYGKLNFGYDRNRISSADRSAALSEDPFARPSAGLLDSLFTPGGGALQRQLVLNRYRQASLSRGKSWSVELPTFSLTYKPFTRQGLQDMLSINLNALYRHSDRKTFDHYTLDYPTDASQAEDYRNRYRTLPSRKYEYGIALGYNGQFGDVNFWPTYTFSQSYSSGRDDLYRLDGLEGFGAADSAALGELPSTTTALETVQDLQNSEHSQRWSKEHQVTLHFRLDKNYGGYSNFRGHFILTPAIRQERIVYERGPLQADNRRTTFVFQPSIELQRNLPTRKGKNLNLQLALSHSDQPADQLYLLDYYDNADPLNVRIGNPNLRRTYRENATLQFNYYDQRYAPLFTLNLYYYYISNAVAMNRTFNPQTGAYLRQPDNVNGNWMLGSYFYLYRQFGKQKRFSFSSTTSPSYYHSVDLTGIEGQVSSVRSVVDNFHLAQTLQLDYGAERWRLGAKAYANWTYAASDRPGFATINAVDYHFGLTGHVTLPGNIDLDTDFTLYSRRGYDDQGLNTDDFVWNARLSKSILRGNLTFIVDAFDILGQLSNVRRQVNAQGWTETYFNVVPRYVMAHVVYRLNLEPKKGKK